MNADRVDVLHHAAFAHESHPLRVHRAAGAENGFFSALARPVSRAANHFAKNQPVRIKCRIPFQRTARLVPKLHPFEKFAETTNENVEKIGVLLRIAWRRAFTGSDAETGRRIMETGKNVQFAREPRQQPIVPLLTALRVPIGPRNSRPQLCDADCFEINK